MSDKKITRTKKIALASKMILKGDMRERYMGKLYLISNQKQRDAMFNCFNDDFMSCFEKYLKE